MASRLQTSPLLAACVMAAVSGSDAAGQIHMPNAGGPQVGTGTGVASTMGEIGRRASYGQDGSWTTSATSDGALVLASRGEQPGWTAAIVRAPSLPYTVEVEVQSGIPATPGRAVGGGIVFGFERPDGARKRSFYTALVADGSVYVYAYDGSFKQLVRSGSGSGSKAGSRWDRLRLTVRDDGFQVSLNDNGSVSQSVSGRLTGEYGVLASGTGQVTFRNLSVH